MDKFGEENHVETQEVVRVAEDSDAEVGALLRRIDWRIMPLLFACFFLQFLDKIIINYANVMGLQKDLGMSGNDFTWMATAFYIGYAVAELPQGYLLQNFPVAYVLGGNVLCWGITICCSGASQTYRDMLALRILLGCFEAVIGPALVLITSTWYSKRQSAPRYGIWFCGLGAAQILGGLISFAAQHGPRSGFTSWRIMMVAVGACNVAVAICVLVFLPSSLERVKWLSDVEKHTISAMLARDQAGNGLKVYRKDGLKDVFLDMQVWLLCLLTSLVVMPSGVIGSFSAIIIKGFGYTAKESALLNMPCGLVSIISTIGTTYAILKGAPRWLTIIVVLIPALIGGGLMSFLSGSDHGGKLAGIYLINTITSGMAIIYSWVGTNTAGYTKRVGSNAMVAVAFGVASIIGPQTFQGKDAPDFIPAKITIMAAAAAAIVVAILLRLLYGYRNRSSKSLRAARLAAAAASHSEVQGLQENATDRTDPEFVYVY